jgi:hypothetical protein
VLNVPERHGFNQVQDLGVAIRTVAGGPQLHVGLLHKTDGTDAMLLHLRTHYDLTNEVPTNQYRWAQVALDEVNRRNVVALCRSIWDRYHNKIPFGFR